MKTLTVLCNVVLAALSVMEVATEGPPNQVATWTLTALIVLVPIFTVVVITRKPGKAGTAVPVLAVLGNLVLLGTTCWAAVAQYPYPEGPSIIPFAVLALLTPVLSLVVLLRGGLVARAARA